MENKLTKLENEVLNLKKELSSFKDLYYRTNMIDKQVYKHSAYFKNDVYLPSKIAFFGGNTPVSQQTAISSPSGGSTIDSEARTAINSIITKLQTLRLTA